MAKAVPKPGSKEARANHCSCPEQDDEVTERVISEDCRLHGSRPEDELPDTI